MLSRESVKTLCLEDRMKMQNRVEKPAKSSVTKSQQRKRANKNRPREMSSKNPVVSGPSTDRPKRRCVDPRFDNLYGEFNDTEFRDQYDFVEDMKKKDMSNLEKSFKKEKDPEKKRQIKGALKRMTDRERELQRVRALKQKLAQEKSQVVEALSQGKVARFKTKTESKLNELVSKFGELKDKGNLGKYLKKKNKSLRSKKPDAPDFTH